MVLNKYLDPKNDFAFKKIFGTEKNKGILIQFLNDILRNPEGERIKKVTFLKPHLDPDTKAKKQSIVDVLCKDEKANQYIVEMQVAHSKGFEKRAQYYASKVYATQMCKGDAYHKLKRVIFLAITDFLLFPHKRGYISSHRMRDDEDHSHDLKDFFFCFVQLPKFHKTLEELETNIERWCYFLKNAPTMTQKELKIAAGQCRAIRQAYAAADQFTWSETEIATYEHMTREILDNRAILESKYDAGLAQGEQIGLQKGEQIGLQKGEQIGLQKGEQIGLQKGEQVGLQKGREEARRALVTAAKTLVAKGISPREAATLIGISPTELSRR